MNLRFLDNQALDQKVISLAKTEKELLAETILYVAEVERRRLYHLLNITSLYNYLTVHAGFSNGSAFRLMDAARLQLEAPDLASKIEAGKINMNQVRLIQEASRQRAKEDRSYGAEAAQGNLLFFIEQDSATNDGNFARFSNENNLDLGITGLEANTIEHSAKSTSTANQLKPKSEIVEALEGLSAAESEKIIAHSLQLKVKKPLKVTRQKDGTVLVQLSFTEEQWAEIEEAKVNVSTSLPNGSYPEVLAHLAKKENLKRKKKSKPRPSTIDLTPAKKKFVLQRDQCCQSKDSHTRKICGSKFNLQVDHIQPRWAGGGDNVENLQALCAAHNRMKYERESGIRRC